MHSTEAIELAIDPVKTATEGPLRDPVEWGKAATAIFISSFKGLCRNESELRELAVLSEEIQKRWGPRGCDLVAARYYNNLDFVRFKKAISGFVKSSQNEFQRALEEFWWLMGLGGYDEVLENAGHFDSLQEMMAKEGLDACKKLAEETRKRANGAARLEELLAQSGCL
jgi:hypothetical protein